MKTADGREPAIMRYVRLPPDLDTEIVALAAAEYRSIQGTLAMLIHEALAARGRRRMKDTAASS